jgi:hypothetical protein
MKGVTVISAPLLATAEPKGLLPPVTHESDDAVWEALAALALVRRFSLADMCDRERVIAVVRTLGFVEGAGWLRANRALYFVALRRLDR